MPLWVAGMQKRNIYLLIWNHSIIHRYDVWQGHTIFAEERHKVIWGTFKGSDMFGLEDCSVSQVQSIRVAHPAESRFYEVGVHARFIEQNDRPYSNGMGRKAHNLVSREIRMQVLATDWNTSAILLAVRYLTMPWWLTMTPIGWSSDWPRRFARR